MVITPKVVRQTTEAAALEINNPKVSELKAGTDGTNVLKSDLANISLIFCRTSSKKNRMTVRSSRNQSVHQSVIEKNPPSSSQSTKSKIIQRKFQCSQ